MKATLLRKVSLAILLASILFLALTLSLPFVKFPETESYSIPQTQATPGSSQVSFYAVPPVDAGVAVNVVFSNYLPADLEFALSPVQGNTMLRSIAHGNAGVGKNFSFSAAPNETASLQLLVLAFNGSGYTVEISSVWSPFYDIRVYTAPAVFLVLASGLATYYFGGQIPRQMAEEKVKEELEARRDSKVNQR